MSAPVGATRVVVVGADAAGMSAAHQALRTARRTGRELAVTVFDQGAHTSYSACGIPYWMAGEVGSGDDLVARTAEEHRAAGIDLRLGVEVVAVDLRGRAVTTGAGEVVGFDELVVATGAPAVVPDWARRDDGSLPDQVGVVKTLDDGAAWLERFAAAGDDAHVVVVGGGYIGVEVAEAALRRGLGVTVITRGRGMSMLEDEMSDRVNAALVAAGAELVLGAGGHRARPRRRHRHGRALGRREPSRRPRRGRDRDPSGHRVPRGHGSADGGERRATTGPARARGRSRVGSRRLLRGAPPPRRPVGLPPARDVRHQARPRARRQPGRWCAHLRRHGRHRHHPLLGGEVHLEIARTGLSRADAEAAGHDPVALLTEGTTASGYLPEAEPIALWVMADRTTRRLLGVQVVGGHGAGKRIDTAAAVLWAGGTVDDLAWMDLSYAPPFATAWEVLQVAARRVAERL